MFNLPEWKKDIMNKSVPSHVARANLSMREQRESLPIYKLRDELIQAIWDNRILVVIGETGSGKTT